MNTTQTPAAGPIDPMTGWGVDLATLSQRELDVFMAGLMSGYLEVPQHPLLRLILEDSWLLACAKCVPATSNSTPGAATSHPLSTKPCTTVRTPTRKSPRRQNQASTEPGAVQAGRVSSSAMHSLNVSSFSPK